MTRCRYTKRPRTTVGSRGRAHRRRGHGRCSAVVGTLVTLVPRRKASYRLLVANLNRAEFPKSAARVVIFANSAGEARLQRRPALVIWNLSTFTVRSALVSACAPKPKSATSAVAAAPPERPRGRQGDHAAEDRREHDRDHGARRETHADNPWRSSSASGRGRRPFEPWSLARGLRGLGRFGELGRFGGVADCHFAARARDQTSPRSS
jgi:hypothetical protein